ncbi:MAG: methyl-accepting chemotaxis protein [Negativicutes bacterium]|nr:methyl-accepting chemotaxis protein [Negativicutes bacterium]
MRITSVKTRLLLILLPFFILSFAVLSGIGYYLSQQSLSKSVNGMAMAVGSDYANRIQARMTENILQLEDIANIPVIRAASDRDQIVAILADSRRRYGKFSQMNFIWPDGNSIRADGSMVNLASREQFKKVTETKKPVVSHALVDLQRGEMSVVFAAPVFDNGQMTGLVSGTYSVANLAELAKEVKFKESGYSFVCDDEGLVVMDSSNPELAGKLSLTKKQIDPALKLADRELDDRLMGLVSAGLEKPVLGRYKFGGVERIGIFTPVVLAGQKWVMVVTVPEAEATEETTTLGRVMMAVSLLFIMLGSLFVMIISKRFAKPIGILRDDCLLLAGGDFREKEAQIHSEDEIGQLARGFRQMRSQLRALVVKVQSQAEQVAAASEELTASAEQSSQAANQVAASISGVAAGANDQLAAADDTSAVVQQMTVNMQQVAVNTQGAAAQSAQAADKAKDGGRAVEKAVAQMGNIEESVNASAKVVEQLGERSKEIGQIVDTIAGIAGQTNLLALNAAIEAARAGEQGRGFAVVAEEVRKLAEQSQEAAKKIAELIGEIQEDTGKAVIAMNDGTREVKTGAEVVNAAGASFKEITDLVAAVSDQVRDVSATIQQMATGSQHIIDRVKRIDELSKKSAGESQSVSAATQEQLASMEEVANSSEALAKLAQELQAAVSSFRV